MGERTSTRLILRNAILNLVTETWLSLVLVASIPVLVSFLGESSFGLFSLAWVLVGYLTFLDAGLGRATTKFVSEHISKSDRGALEQIVQVSLLWNLLLGVLGGIGVALSTPFLIRSIFNIPPALESQAIQVFHAAALCLPFLLVQGVVRGVLASLQRFGWINLVHGLTTTAQWLLACLLAWQGQDVVVVVWVTFGARIVATGFYLVLLLALQPGLFRSVRRRPEELPKLLRFGIWVTVSQIIGPVMVYLDRLLIASFVSLAALTVYTVPTESIGRLRILPASLTATLFPAVSEQMANQETEETRRLYWR
ncbi:MAG: oligosaccharide flippase family protein, partial [Terriglobia bacterium]